MRSDEVRRFAPLPRTVYLVSILLREALFPSVGQEKLMSVRPSVRPSVRTDNNYFLSKRMRGRYACCWTLVVWIMDFRGSRKNPSLIWISDWDQPVQGPVSGHCFGNIFERCYKNEDPPDHAGYSTFLNVFSDVT